MRKDLGELGVELAAPTRKQNAASRLIPLTTEQGTSGLHAWGGYINEAYNQQLAWPQVHATYDKLRRSMPEIVMIRQAYTGWARGIRPIVELPDNHTDDDKRYKEFIESDFDNMEGGFIAFIDTLVNHVPFMGWGWWEVVLGVRDPLWKPPQGDEWRSEEDDGLIGVRRLAWRDTGSFQKWEMDDKKRMVGMWQQDPPNQAVQLRLRDSLHMTFGDPNNPEGLTPMEAIWRLERIRFGYEVIMGIGFEHSAGYLDVTKTDQGTLGDDDKKMIEEAAYNVLTAKEGNYAAWPPGITGSIKDIPFSASNNLLEAIRHYSILTFSVYMMQFVAFNTFTNMGSYAATKDISQLAIATFNSMMDGFAGQYDQQVGRKLWDLNKESFPNMTKRPVIKFSHVEKDVDLGAMGTFLKAIDGIVPLGEQDQKAIRQRSAFLPETLPDVSATGSDSQPQVSPSIPNPSPAENPAVAPVAAGANGKGSQ